MEGIIQDEDTLKIIEATTRLQKELKERENQYNKPQAKDLLY